MQPRAAALLAVLVLSLGASQSFAEEPKKAPAAKAEKATAAKAESSKAEASKAEPAKAEKGESAPQGASAATASGAPDVQRESTSKEGEKSYQFGAVEVEGRLKAPQILYFVRRVRAELKSGQLGHRSFMPELRDTRRGEVLR